MTPGLPDKVYIALLKSKTPTADAFKLRPNGEDSLSIAATERKARGTLKCKGYAVLLTAKINAIDGLRVQVKRPSEQPDENITDPDYLEIMGLPIFGSDNTQINDYAEALLKTVCDHVSFDVPVRLPAGD